MRYKDVEFRQAGVTDSNGYTIEISKERPAEIIAYVNRGDGKESCYTLCWIKEDEEGWYIETTGNRFTEYEDTEALMHVARYALRMLNTEKEFREGCYD